MVGSLAVSLQNCRPAHILLVRYWFQVSGIDASANPAEMIKFQSIRNLIHQEIPYRHMGMLSQEPAIAFLVENTVPLPASCLPVDDRTTQELFAQSPARKPSTMLQIRIACDAEAATMDAQMIASMAVFLCSPHSGHPISLLKISLSL